MPNLKQIVAAGLFCGLMTSPARAENPPAFSSGTLSGWQEKTFSSLPHTSYQLVTQDGATILHAVCQNSASGLIWKHEIDLTQTPILTWRWKISRVYPNLDPHTKFGDDYPARVYVVVGNPLLPWTLRSLVYVWANGSVVAAAHDPQGTPIYPDPYTKQAEIVALRQGPSGTGAWTTEQRNLRTDLAHAFGGDFTAIGAVAVMSDCDDSHNFGQAWYGDVRFLEGAPLKP
ncbi:MAG TPA: DUF3047 domain-containing protein [Acidocella sp.]|nr:DUF3047 domain-containing protein [Acidocella sp.]